VDELSEAEYAKKIARIKQIEEKIQPLWEEKRFMKLNQLRESRKSL